MIELTDVEAAAARITSYVRRTPMLRAEALREPLGDCAIWFKLECLQATGSFKARGATNRLLATPPGQLAAGIVTASGGNHGLAVARAGWLASVPATIYLPRTVSPEKVEKLESWGATIEIAGTVWDESNQEALGFAQRTGAVYMHPFADPLVVAGQGTVALEVLEGLPDVDTLLVAIGGGGLISGVATAIKAQRPNVRIIGIEPEGAPTLKSCLDAGQVVTLSDVSTIVPTMACGRTDERIFEIVRDYVDEIVLISDQSMRDAARWLWFELGLAVDLSGAAAVAALRSGKITIAPDAKVCALVCGAGSDGMS